MNIAATARGTRALKVFFSYARRDENMRDKLFRHLSPLEDQRLIERWYDRRIPPGDNWQDQIDKHLEEADVILLLISDAFMSSRYCTGREMNRAIERSKANEAIVIPILLRAVDTTNAPFAELQALPDNGKPIANSKNPDTAYTNIAKGIRQRVEDYWTTRSVPQETVRGPVRPPVPANTPRKPAPEAEPPSSHTSLGAALQKAIAAHPAPVSAGQSDEPSSPSPSEFATNPYDFEHPARLFFRGRRQELSDLTAHLGAGRSALVLGLQRMGKTSLVERAVEYLQDPRYSRRRYIVLKIDMFASWNSFKSYLDFFFAIVNLLADQLAQTSSQAESNAIRDAFSESTRTAFDTERYERLKSVLKTAAQRTGASIILFIDEFQEVERVFQRSRERHIPNAFDAGVMRWIGSLAKDQIIQLMICGRYRALAVEEREALEMFKTHLRIPLGPLDEQSARELIRDPVAGQIAYENEAIRTILEMSGCLPYLIQLLCSRLVAMSRVRRSAIVRKKDVDEIADNILRDPASKVNLGVLYTDFKEMSNGQLWRALRAIAQLWRALRAIAQLSHEPNHQASLHDIAHQIKQNHGVAISIDHLPDLMDELVMAGVVEETGKGRLRTYRILADLLRLWLRKRHVD